MLRPKIKYELQSLQSGRWQVVEVHDSERHARDAAVKLLRRHDVEGARVVRDWLRNDDRHVERVVYSEIKETKQTDIIRPNAIDTAHYCQTDEDYFRLESRLAINRVIRGYLDKHVLTPTELLHNYRELRRMSDYDTLLTSSADRVAAVQCRQSGEEGRARRDAILTSISHILAKAREAERNRVIQAMTGKDFAAAFAAVSEVADAPETRDYLALVAFSKHLVGNRNWFGKLAALVAPLGGNLDPEAARLLDGVIADILGSPAVIQELLGWQPDLATALCRLGDFCDGQLRLDGRPADDVARDLNRLFHKGALPSTRTVLLDRIQRQLAGGGALNRMEPASEPDAFAAIVDRFLLADGAFGGPATAEAVTRRALRLGERGGAPGESDAIAEVVRRLPQSDRRVAYLTALAATPLGHAHVSDILRHLGSVTGRASIDEIVDPRLDPTAKMAAITRLFEWVSEAPLPEGERQRHSERLDELLARYLVKEGIIEKMDNPEDSLRNRAFRLVHFCASGVLTRGRAMTMARERVIGHIRKPNFDTELVADLPSPAAREEALREFFSLLRKAGFR